MSGAKQSFMERINLKGGDIKVTVSVWKGEPRVDIRTFEKGYATKRGVSLSLQRWYHLINLKDEIDGALMKAKNSEALVFKRHLGRNVFLELVQTRYNSYKVDIRQYFLPEGNADIIPTLRGVRLSVEQWQQLRSLEDKVIEHFPELKDFIPCSQREDHYNQLGFLSCQECTPNPDKVW